MRLFSTHATRSLSDLTIYVSHHLKLLDIIHVIKAKIYNGSVPTTPNATATTTSYKSMKMTIAYHSRSVGGGGIFRAKVPITRLISTASTSGVFDTPSIARLIYLYSVACWK